MGVRCPRCGTKVGEELKGTLTVFCRKCKVYVTIDNRISV